MIPHTYILANPITTTDSAVFDTMEAFHFSIKEVNGKVEGECVPLSIKERANTWEELEPILDQKFMEIMENV